MQSRSTVLIVDDEPAIRRFLSVALTAEGYAVAEARDGQEALDLLRGAAALPDLILVDLMMPRMDGGALVVALGNDARLRSVPVILLSAVRFEHDESTRQIVGQFDKPFVLDELLAFVETLLTSRPPSQASYMSVDA